MFFHEHIPTRVKAPQIGKYKKMRVVKEKE
jgi:hypothetical protein